MRLRKIKMKIENNDKNDNNEEIMKNNQTMYTLNVIIFIFIQK